uniref:Uncharacterized protein n=1 Tax=Cyanothece sp. (strain PCC 7425 / ATCC 29141) TaxID=395961 RepID=B8HMV5_CYAP4
MVDPTENPREQSEEINKEAALEEELDLGTEELNRVAGGAAPATTGTVRHCCPPPGT